MKMMENKRALMYQGGNLLYIIGWILTLIGLSMSQNECKDQEMNGVVTPPLRGEFFTVPGDDDCEKTFRFFWFMWALSTLPPLLAVMASIKPDMFRGMSTSFFAVLAPLTMLMANSFYDAFDDHNDLSDDMEDALALTMSGWAILAGACLLMLLMDSLLVSDSKPSSGIVQDAPAAAK